MKPTPVLLLLADLLSRGHKPAALASACRVSGKTLRGWADGSRTPRNRMQPRVRGALEQMLSA